MRNNLKLVIIAILLSLAAQTSAAAENKITVVVVSDDAKLQGTELSFNEPTALSQVYQALSAQGVVLEQIDFSRMRLVSATKQGEVELQRQQLVQRLYQLQGYWREQPQRADLARRVAEQVARWPVIGAEPIGPAQLGLIKANTFGELPDLTDRFAVSPQQANYQAYSNVILTAGDRASSGRYQLWLPRLDSSRQQHPVLGALWVPFQLPHQPNLSVYQQLREHQFSSRIDPIAEQRHIAELTVAGEVQLHPLASLTQRAERLSYGSLLLVLFDESSLPSQFKQLNQHMLELLVYFSPLADWQGFGPVTVNSAAQQPVIYDDSKRSSPLERITNTIMQRDKPWQPTSNNFGTVGLLQTPTARMAEAGQFNFNYHDGDQYRHMALNLQLLPWLETTVRYNDIRTRLYSPFEGFSGDQTYKDRGIDVKARLLKESTWLPELSVGLRDAAGTGLFAGEYVVASKNFGQLDVSAGIGWGYLGKNANITNPFCRLKDSFCTRPTGTSGSGGLFETDKWLHGDSAWFGGLEYQFNQWPLSLKLEYDPNNYRNEPATVFIKQDSRVNIGLDYEVADGVHAKLSFERGNTLMFGASFTTNFNSLDLAKIDLDSQRPAFNDSNLRSEQLRYGKIQERVMFALRDDLSNEAGFRLDEVWLSSDGSTMTLIGNSFRYRDHRIMLQRLGQIAANELPNEVTRMLVVEQTNTMTMAETEFDLQLLRQALLRLQPNLTIADTYQRQQVSVRNQQTEQQLFRSVHAIGWPSYSVTPFIEQSFGGPEDFYMYMLGLDARINWSLSQNSFIAATVAGSLVNNYDKFNFLQTPTNLPPVRTRIREYVSSTDVWLRSLVGVYQQQLGNSLYGQLHGGYFETMFAGVGAEMLYRPLDSDWSVGLDVNYVRQRDPYDQMQLLDYAVWTGHASLYYKPQRWLPNSLIQVHAGQFLAGDKGVQVTYEQKFKSGIIAGVFAAKTNVSAEDFGEGSFNKGFFISIPFDLLQLRHSRGRGTIGWIPITRDGGQMLIREHRLPGFADDRSRFYTD